MSGFIKGADRNQVTLFPESLDGYIAEESAVRVIDVFVDELDLGMLGLKTTPADTGRSTPVVRMTEPHCRKRPEQDATSPN